VQCHGAGPRSGASWPADSHGQAGASEEPIFQCTNRNPYDMRIWSTRNGQVLARSGKTLLGWARLDPAVIPAHGAVPVSATFFMRTNGHTGDFDTSLELTTKGVAEMGLFITVVTASFEQVTACAVSVRARASGVSRGPPVCGPPGEALPRSAPGLDGAAPAPAFTLNLDQEAFHKAGRMLKAISGFLLGASAMLCISSCSAGSWLLLHRSRCGMSGGAPPAPPQVTAAPAAVSAKDSPDDSVPPPVHERPDNTWPESPGFIGVLPFHADGERKEEERQDEEHDPYAVEQGSAEKDLVPFDVEEGRVAEEIPVGPLERYLSL